MHFIHCILEEREREREREILCHGQPIRTKRYGTFIIPQTGFVSLLISFLCLIISPHALLTRIPFNTYSSINFFWNKKTLLPSYIRALSTSTIIRLSYNMGLDDVCNAGLALALGSHEKQENHDHLQPDHHQEKKKKKRKKEKFSLKYDHLFPSLTLGPSDETSYTYQLATTKKEAGKAVLGGDSVDYLPNKQASSLSAVSSFSNSSSIKRERELSGGEEEVEVERVSSRVSDEDDEASPRKKLRLTKEQSAILEDNFKEHATLNPVIILSFFIFVFHLSLCIVASMFLCYINYNHYQCFY